MSFRNKSQAKMKKFLFILSAIVIIYLSVSFYFVDKSYFICPIEYQYSYIIRNDVMGEGEFGAKRSGGRSHNGIDLLAEIGTPAYACRGGRVIAATSSKGMGNYVIIQHSGGLTSVYGHLSELLVKKNAFVRQGQIIGKVGKTGNANYPNMQPHLHFEVRENNSPIDPSSYIR